ncbi:asparagine synthase-related protein [Nocardia fluminea]|uniref:asparagine synthase-related protein n=1 Tax=Nocardia fluminea TaxID=134984 RepID=UPI00366119E4
MPDCVVGVAPKRTVKRAGVWFNAVEYQTAVLLPNRRWHSIPVGDRSGEQVHADVPAGMLLSGGIDSSTVIALAVLALAPETHLASSGPHCAMETLAHRESTTSGLRQWNR